MKQRHAISKNIFELYDVIDLKLDIVKFHDLSEDWAKRMSSRLNEAEDVETLNTNQDDRQGAI